VESVRSTRSKLTRLSPVLAIATCRPPIRNETDITALEQVDLTRAQKLDARHYLDHCVVVFNRDLNGCRRGERGTNRAEHFGWRPGAFFGRTSWWTSRASKTRNTSGWKTGADGLVTAVTMIGKRGVGDFSRFVNYTDEAELSHRA
jgi:hypothetical protein